MFDTTKAFFRGILFDLGFDVSSMKPKNVPTAYPDAPGMQRIEQRHREIEWRYRQDRELGDTFYDMLRQLWQENQQKHRLQPLWYEFKLRKLRNTNKSMTKILSLNVVKPEYIVAGWRYGPNPEDVTEVILRMRDIEGVMLEPVDIDGDLSAFFPQALKEKDFRLVSIDTDSPSLNTPSAGQDHPSTGQGSPSLANLSSDLHGDVQLAEEPTLTERAANTTGWHYYNSYNPENHEIVLIKDSRFGRLRLVQYYAANEVHTAHFRPFEPFGEWIFVDDWEKLTELWFRIPKFPAG